MKTVEWKGITLTVVPISEFACSTKVGDQRIWCAMSDDRSTECNDVCPNGPALLLEGDDLAKYLAAKLMKDVQ